MGVNLTPTAKLGVQDVEVRDYQWVAVSNIRLAFRRGFKTVFLDAPVGTGKSLIHMLVGNGFESIRASFITTPQVLLVDQYARDTGPNGKFAGLAETLKGRAHYPCPYLNENRQKQLSFPQTEGGTEKLDPEEEATRILEVLAQPSKTAAEGPCMDLKGWPEGEHVHTIKAGQSTITTANRYDGCPVFHAHRCPYYVEKAKALAAPCSVMTLAYLWVGVLKNLESRAPGTSTKAGWGGRDLLIVDEAHGLESTLTNFLGCSISRTKLKKGYRESLKGFDFDGITEASDPLQFVLDELPYYIETLKEEQSLKQTASRSNPSLEQLKELHRVTNALREAERLQELLGNLRVKWVHTYKREEGKKEVHHWRPLQINLLASRLFQCFPKVLLSTGTLLDAKRMVEALGLALPWTVVSVTDRVPPSSAPIYLMDVANLKFKTLGTTLPLVQKAVETIAQAHAGQRGLIHCHSYALAKYLRSHSSPELLARMVEHDSENRNETYYDWTREGEDGSILMAVNMAEGIDLPGDLARWQIILKAPFADLKDDWVRARRELFDGEAWYGQEALVKVMQACGRIIRSSDDWGQTYVLDTNVHRLIGQYWGALPDWFKSRLVTLPKPGVTPEEVTPPLWKGNSQPDLNH